MTLKLPQRLRLGLLSVLMIVVGGRASAKNENTSGLLGGDLAFARTHSDYFEFFHLEPSGDAQPSAGGKMNCFKPTGPAFRQVVAVYVETNPEDSIVGIRVVLARSFIEDPQNGIFARDLIKSSLLSAVSATDAATLRDLGTEILHRDARRTLLVGKEPLLSPTPSAAYLVVSGVDQTWEAKLQASKIRLSNETEEGRPSLIITIAAQ